MPRLPIRDRGMNVLLYFKNNEDSFYLRLNEMITFAENNQLSLYNQLTPCCGCVELVFLTKRRCAAITTWIDAMALLQSIKHVGNATLDLTFGSFKENHNELISKNANPCYPVQPIIIHLLFIILFYPE